MIVHDDTAVPRRDQARRLNNQRWLNLVLLSVSAVLLFTRLGHYPLWCDEADTALFARSVWETGDTSAVLGHNVYAFRGGMLLDDLHNRYTPPLSYYLLAPVWGLVGDDTFWLRFPFALCGWLTVCLIVAWLERVEATWRMRWQVAVGLLTNVSFFLFARQCRYYALAMLATTVLVFAYLELRGWRRVLLMLAASMVLLGTNSLCLLSVYVAGGVDYAIWGRRDRRLSRRELVTLLTTLLLASVALFSIYNPLGKEFVAAPAAGHRALEKLLVWSWYLRDLNACEFGVGLMLLAAPLVGWWTHDRWLTRMAAAGWIYLTTVALASPDWPWLSSQASVRYLVPILPLCVMTTVRVVDRLTQTRRWLAVPLFVLACGTNVLHVPWSPSQWRSTLGLFVSELISPRVTPLAEIIAWLNERAAVGESAWVVPNYETYPLMFHVPRVLYAWQLDQPPRGQFSHLPLIHFVGVEPVDYVIALGPMEKEARRVVVQLERQGVRFEPVQVIDTYWREGTRPELIEHLFRSPHEFDRQTEAVYIYRRVANERRTREDTISP